jgi:hypothetical protein
MIFLITPYLWQKLKFHVLHPNKKIDQITKPILLNTITDFLFLFRTSSSSGLLIRTIEVLCRFHNPSPLIPIHCHVDAEGVVYF